MIRQVLALVFAVSACNPGLPAARAGERQPEASASRLPRREDLVCFPCHSQAIFEKGPKFAHGSTAHRGAGHCHVCHRGAGHEPRAIERSACLTCHGEQSPELGILATDDTPSR